MCWGQCTTDATLKCPLTSDSLEDSPTGGVMGDTRFTVGGNSAGVETQDGDADDNYLVASIGRVVLDGMGGDDILEDHDAQALLIGGAGDDRLISRNGRDALWGGNAFGITYCLDDIPATETDEAGNSCDWYETNPEECGNWDDDDFMAKDFCCICGGGNCVNANPVLVAA